MKKEKLTRRDFIKKATLTGAGLAAGGSLLTSLNALAQGKVYLPLILKSPATPTPTATPTNTPTATPTTPSEPPPPPSDSRVVHVHDPNATDWDFSTGWYGDHVDQARVNDMVDQGVMALTGTSTVADAWRALIPNYAPGEAIAIKVSFNNAWSCDDSDDRIDALIHPVNAAVRGLKHIGVAEEDIWVYEAVRRIPNRFVNGCPYNVQFFSGQDCPPLQSPGWSSDDPDAFVTFNPPSGPAPPSIRIPDVLVNAAYLINMPIIKRHVVGVSLGFKNHLGTVKYPGELHDYIRPDGSLFRTDYSPYVDIYQNPHVGAKTILTIGDGLFGSWYGYTAKPEPWTTFGDVAANSLFFATDPVALDSVMYDFLAAETTIIDNADVYLNVAENAGLGVFEHGAPWGSGYNTIDYVKIEPPY